MSITHPMSHDVDCLEHLSSVCSNCRALLSLLRERVYKSKKDGNFYKRKWKIADFRRAEAKSCVTFVRLTYLQ